MRPTEDPNRPCSICGDTSRKTAMNVNGNIKYSNICNNCSRARIRKRIITKCSDCGCEKEPNWYYFCKPCTVGKATATKNRRKSRLTYEEKLEIKHFCEKAETEHFYVDISGINKVITLYNYVALSDTEDYLQPGEQLSYMWNFLYDYYKSYIRGVEDTQLRFKKLYKLTRKSMKPPARYINYTDLNSLKTCTKCNEDKLGSEFYLSPSRDILTAHCKACSKKFYQKKRDVLKKRKKLNT